MIQRSVPGTQAVHRALSLLKVLGDEGPAWRLTDLAAATGLHKATARRLLGALEREGMVGRDATGELYQLGPEAIALGARAGRTTDLRSVCRPVLVALAEGTGETATLEVLVGPEILVLDEVQGGAMIGATADVGSRWPAHATSTGKALLSAGTASVIPPGKLVALTQRTITSRARMDAELRKTRRRGYGVGIEELETGYVAVASVVRNRDGDPLGALSLGGPRARFAAARIKRLGQEVKAAAERVSVSLGYRC